MGVLLSIQPRPPRCFGVELCSTACLSHRSWRLLGHFGFCRGRFSSQKFMRSVDMILLLALVVQVHAADLGKGANYDRESQESKDVVANPFARNLFKRSPNLLPLGRSAVDNTALGKLSNRAI